MTREQDRIQERHQCGMCGGDCFECHKQQAAERQRQNYEDAQQIDYEPQQIDQTDLDILLTVMGKKPNAVAQSGRSEDGGER